MVVAKAREPRWARVRVASLRVSIGSFEEDWLKSGLMVGVGREEEGGREREREGGGDGSRGGVKSFCLKACSRFSLLIFSRELASLGKM